MTGEPLVSVVIRVRDEEVALRDVLAELRTQRLRGQIEVVVIDNESADRSAEVALRAGARVFSLPRQMFGYGRTLNLGVQLARGRIVVMLSAHSVPQDDDWLAELIEPILDDARVGAAFCRQVPESRVSRLEQARFDCFPDGNRIVDRERLVAACEQGADPYVVALFSNSACAIRREVAVENKFRDLMYAEDRAFAVDYLMAGGAIAFAYASVVSYHRTMTWKSAYRVACRAQVSRRLIRELAATYTGTRYSSRWDTLDRVLRAVLIVPGLAVKLGMAVRETRGLRARSALFAWRSTGGTLGLAKGALRWRGHVATLNCDVTQLDLARRNCVRLHAETEGSVVAG